MLRHFRLVSLCAVLIAIAFSAASVTGQAPATPVATEFEGLHFRSIGPATMSGRIADLAVYEANPAIYYVGDRARRRVEDHEQRRDVQARSSRTRD